MAKWCCAYGESVTFLCLSVEGLNIARYFNQYTGASMNATMLPNEIPSFPIQLGCSGFVVIDKDGCILTTRSTPSFLDAGEDAFRAVETLLGDLIGLTEKSIASKEDHKNELSEHDLVLMPLPHVGHCEMDAEHAKIDSCLKELVVDTSVENLRKLKTETEIHFQHEEELLAANQFGTTGILSAYESHAADHGRILKNIESILETAHNGTGKISQTDVTEVASLIHQHGVRFDSLYAKKVSCRSCERT